MLKNWDYTNREDFYNPAYTPKMKPAVNAAKSSKINRSSATQI